MNTGALTDLADQLYDLSEHAAGGEHNLKAAIDVGSFNIMAFLQALAAATPEILALLSALLGQTKTLELKQQ